MPGWKHAGVITLALIATTAIWTAAPSAEAGPRRARTQRVELVRPDHSTDADATGVVKVRDGRRVDVMVVKLRRLDPRTEYEVRDMDTEQALASVRTNRRGRARVRLRASTVRKAALTDLPNAVGVFAIEGDECVLETDEPIGDTGPVEGFEEYEGPGGHTGVIGLIAIPEFDMECFLLSMYPPVEGGEDRADGEHGCPTEVFELMIEKGFGDELPLGVESARELAERAFEIRDGEGVVVLDGNLPAVEAVKWHEPFPDGPDMPDMPPWMDDMPPWMDDMPPMGDMPTMGNRNAGGGFFAFKQEVEKSEFVLWIADGDGVLQEIEALDHFDFGDFFDDFPEYLGPPDREDAPNDERGFPAFR